MLESDLNGIPSPFRLFFRYALFGFIGFVFLAFVLFQVWMSVLERYLIEETKKTKAKYTSALVGHVLTREDFRGVRKGLAWDSFEKKMAPLFALPEVVRVKVYDRSGVLIWSDSRELMEQSPSAKKNPELLEALEGHVEAEISHLTKEEHRFERGTFHSLMELYVPIYLGQEERPIGVAEVYMNVDPIFKIIRSAGGVIGFTVIAGMGLLLFSSFFGLGRAVGVIHKKSRELSVSHASLEEKVEQQTRDLFALYDITTTVNQSLEVDPVLREVIKKITGIFHFDATRIYLFNNQMDELHLQASFETEPEFWARVRVFRRGQGNIGKVAETGEPLIFEDIHNNPQYQQLSHTKSTQKAGFSFFAAFPIKTKLRTVGTIVCIGRMPRCLKSDEFRLITSMTEQIGVAIENSRLFEEVKRKSIEQSALREVLSNLLLLDLDSLLERMTQQAVSLFNAEVAWVRLFDKQGKLWSRAIAGDEAAISLIPVRAVGELVGRGKWMLDNRRPLAIKDMAKDSDRPYSELYKKADLHGFLGAPLFSRDGKPLGVIFVLTHSPRDFSQREIELIEQFANGAAVAIQNAALFEETVKRAEQLSALHSVAATVSQSLELEVVLDKSIKKVLEVLKFDAARIFLLNLKGNQLEVRAHKNLSEELSHASPYRLGEGIIGKVWQSGQMIAIENMETDPKYRELATRGATFQAGFRSQITFPIPVKEKIFGVGNYYCYRPRHFTPEELQLISSMANQIGVAIENASLFEEIKNKTTELENINRDLEEASRAKSDFLASMSHELRTPLNVIVGNTDLVKDGTFGEVSEKQRSVLEKVQRYSRMLLKLINDVLTLTRIEAKKMSLHASTIYVDEIITHARGYVDQLNLNGHLEVLWKVEQNLPPMTTDALKLEEILQNLIGNAFKFTPEGAIEVRVRDLVGKDRIEFAVADTGIGIEESDLDKVFERFYQHKESHTGNYSGVGLGLNIVKSYLELMRGEIRVESQPGRGSTFTFTLPYSL
jgi:signal transduction histidine kinase